MSELANVVEGCSPLAAWSSRSRRLILSRPAVARFLARQEELRGVPENRAVFRKGQRQRRSLVRRSRDYVKAEFASVIVGALLGITIRAFAGRRTDIGSVNLRRAIISFHSIGWQR